MAEVSGPVIAIALVLCAVFVPTAFMAGISGEFFRQFALTIAASTIISAFNSLTLSPALCAILFKGHGDTPTGQPAQGHGAEGGLPRLGLVVIVALLGVLHAHAARCSILECNCPAGTASMQPMVSDRRRCGAFGWFPSPRARPSGGSWPDW